MEGYIVEKKIPDQSIELWKYFSWRSLLTKLTAQIGARLGLGAQLCFEAPDKLRVNIVKMYLFYLVGRRQKFGWGESTGEKVTKVSANEWLVE